jgi:hypothetical protein
MNTQPVTFHGHEVTEVGDIFTQQGELDKAVLPLDVSGHVYGRSAQQLFCRTPSPLPLGMCGGPAVVTMPMAGPMDKDMQRGQGSYIAGLVEGIVPADHAQKSLRNLAVFVESADIDK